MPDKDESRRFEEIVAGLRQEDPRFAAGAPRRSRGRVSLAAGIALCAVAAGLVALGGVKGAVLAVLPWLIGLVLVFKSRVWR